MEILLRVLQLLMKIVFLIMKPFFAIFCSRNYDAARIPAIKNPVLTLTLLQILERLKRKELTSQQLVKLYITRIEEVNPFINAVVQDRFSDAIKDAIEVDKILQLTSNDELKNLYRTKPLLGVPFTVKEACGVRGMKQIVGNFDRINATSERDGDVIHLVREAGAIPLLVSANPEYCFSIETFSHTHGRCLNPYDSRMTTGGSSGGEGALNGAGASLFGIGSDIAGSIRLPCMFNGVFGHKPTAGITSIEGHFPSSSNDINCQKMLQMGPITRFASDLSLILRLISGTNAGLLKLDETVNLQNIKIYYSYGFTGLNAILRQPVDREIKKSIFSAVQFFESMGLQTKPLDFEGFEDSFEIALSAIARLEKFPYVLNTSSQSKLLEVLVELFRSLIFTSKYTKEALLFEMSRRANSFMARKNLLKYKEKALVLKDEIVKTLGENGVLIFPTFPMSAFPRNTSLATIWSVDYTLLFNVLELPATHVPMGLNSQGLPIGFQVIAAPFNDKLCLKIAAELESGFGGWVPPIENAF